ncbi:MAG: DUF4476 domain-containing protein [Archangium sp.]|nr:DUF4476 domain-containing protein [Archangium sp.]MDP3575648.1 DUF4476 domain-containing protein [Archangium sp.]
MKAITVWLLLPLSAVAGSKGALRALEEAQELVEASDAECSKRLGKKLEALEGEIEDGLSSRKLRVQVREVRSFAEDRCPKRLAAKVKRALAALEGDDDDDEDDRRPRRRRSSDDDEEDEAPKRRAVPLRDCGTGPDPGCNLPGTAAMDAVSFRGLVSSLSSTQNELTRLELVRNALSAQRITAMQLGPLLDAFQNELLRLDAAKAAAPRLVDPQHALVHSGKWRNSLLAADFSRLLAR